MLFGAPPLSSGHHIARTPAELQAMVSELRSAPTRAFDFEADGLKWADGNRPIGYSIGYIAPTGWPRCWYVPFGHRTAEVQAHPAHAKAAFNEALYGASELVGHNLKFDLNMGRADGWDIDPDVPIHDTLIQAYLCYEKRKMQLESVASQDIPGLPWDAFAMKNLVGDIEKDRAKAHKLGIKEYRNRFGHAEVPVQIEAEYSCRDTFHALMLDRNCRGRAMAIGQPWETQRRYLYANEMWLVRAIAEMEWNGQPLDVDYMHKFAAELDDDLARRGRELSIKFGAHIDWSNDNEVRDLLYRHLRLPVLKTTDHGKPSIDRAALLMLRNYHPGIEMLSEYSVRDHVRDGFTTSLAARCSRDGRLRTSFLQAHVVSGRFSSRDPNFQNIPTRHAEMAKAIRKAWRIEPGQARIFGDYSQIELRMLAWITQCPTLVWSYASQPWDWFRAGHLTYDQYVEMRKTMPEVDVHANVAKAVFRANENDADWKVKRRAAKIINFGVPYGMGWRGLMSNPELMLPEGQAKQFYGAYHQANPEVNATKQAVFSKMLRNHGVPKFINWAGRTVHGPGLRSSDEGVRGEEERSIFASLVQGSAAELTRCSLVQLYFMTRSGALPAKLTSTVHDEIQLDCAEADVVPVAKEVRRVMENFHGHFGNTPIVVGLESSTTTWADKKELHI